MKRYLLFVWLLFCVVAEMGLAQQVTVQLDPAATQVEFTLGSTMHTVHGNFRLTSGAITFDPATGKASGILVVDAASGESGNHSRDRKMTKEILEAGKFPELTFTARGSSGETGGCRTFAPRSSRSVSHSRAGSPIDVAGRCTIGCRALPTSRQGLKYLMLPGE